MSPATQRNSALGPELSLIRPGSLYVMIRLEGQLVFGHHVLEFTQSEGPQGSQAVGAGRSVLSCLAIDVLSGEALISL